MAPANRDLAGVEVELAGAEQREFKLRDALEPIKDSFDHIFLDCPPSLGLLTLNSLVASQGILVPVQCEYLALEGLSDLIDTTQRVQLRFNPQLRIDGILLTMYDDRTNLTRQVAEDIRSHFGDAVFQTVIPRNIRLGEAPSHGKAIFLYDIRSRGAEAYLSLAKEFLQNETKGVGQRAS